ncbi:MAG TPA: acyl-CoA dehydrogenase family protein [Myxococcaceae bacterium]|nr:acyl-CoA dehydrogenase family protein [Myxococcaceae bacterium]
MNFELPEPLASLRQKVRAFVDERVIPAERRIVDEDRDGKWDALKALQAEVRAAGMWTPHLPQHLGGQGLGVMGMCALFREMGRSLLGAKCFNCDAPDQGNMDLLLAAGSAEIKERYLAPLARGEISSAFCMTEPAPGAGADPSNLRTAAKRDGGDWVIDGHKWFSTGGGRASFLIVMARTSDDPKTGASMFVVDRKAPGVEHVRDVKTMALEVLDHREAELRFRGVRVPASAVLGEIGQGFKLAQTRLVPARLTHCMRWLGLAERTLNMCREYAATRVSFGKELARHQAIQKMFADNARAIHAGNLMTYHCAWMMERGQHQEARPYSSMAKNQVAQLLCQVLDDAIQMHGALGYSEDMPFSFWYRMARAARIADGPDEVHDMTVARDFLLGRLNVLV